MHKMVIAWKYVVYLPATKLNFSVLFAFTASGTVPRGGPKSLPVHHL